MISADTANDEASISSAPRTPTSTVTVPPAASPTSWATW
jgi:hypothetical protein